MSRMGKINKESINAPKKDIIQKNHFLFKIIPPAILVLLATLFYYPSLYYPFQFDDLANITKKFIIRNDDPLSRWWYHSRWMGDWLNRFNYKIGEFNPFYYRLINLIIHTLVGLLIFYLILKLCNLVKKNNFLQNNSTIIAFTTAALFLLHPVQTQTVSYVIQARLEGLATLFIILTVYLFTSAFTTQNKFLKSLLLALTFITAFLSCGTKEIVVVTPILLLITDWFFLAEENWEKFKTRIGWHLLFIIMFFIVLSNYLSFSFFTRAAGLNMTTANNRGNILTKHAYDIITPLQFLISEFKVILHYLIMFIWPFNISVEYDWKLSESFFSADSFFPFLALVSIVATTIYLFIKKQFSFITFGIFWFLISVTPRASIIPSPELICDYKTYLASAGWLFIIAIVLVKISDLISNKIINNLSISEKLVTLKIPQTIPLSIFIIIAGVGTINRNIVWRSPTDFWSDIVVKAPLKARGHNNLGVALSEAGKIDDSIIQYKKAIELDKFYADPLSNIAVAYSLKGEIDKAIEALKSAINIFPNYPEAYNNLGTLLLRKKDYENAEKALDFAIQLRPYYGKAFYNKGRLYMEKNEEEKAWGFFKKATEGDLDNADGFYTLGQVSIRLKKYDEAAKAFEQIISKGINKQEVYFNLANSYFMLKKYDEAKNIYQALATNNPLDARYYYNLAETYLTQNNTEKALELFQKTTTLPNTLPQAYFKVVSCFEKLNKIDKAKDYLVQMSQIDKAPEDFKKAVKEEQLRLELQEKVNKNGGSIKISDLQKIFNKPSVKKT